MRYAADADLRDAARALLAAAGMDEPLARDVADVLVEGDLLGHDTHGLALLAPYLAELEAGRMARQGSVPRPARARRGRSLGWRTAAGSVAYAARDRVARSRCRASSALAPSSMRRSHHIGCLAAYLTRATERGFVMLLTCSDPSGASVAPHGGLKAGIHARPDRVRSSDVE